MSKAGSFDACSGVSNDFDRRCISSNCYAGNGRNRNEVISGSGITKGPPVQSEGLFSFMDEWLVAGQTNHDTRHIFITISVSSDRQMPCGTV
jgi:hypothetical protein